MWITGQCGLLETMNFILHQNVPMKRIDTVQPMNANGIYIPEIYSFEKTEKINFIVSY